MAWTEQMVEDLRTMWKQGMTTAEIGKNLMLQKFYCRQGSQAGIVRTSFSD